MKISIIHGSQRNGNTEKTIEIVKEKLNSLEDNDFFDFYLPKDLPMFCCGCFKCMDKGNYGGEHCPHSKYTHPILEAMKLSDGIIVTSPVYSMAESGQVKAFLDHFACIFMCHKPLQEMFSKTAFIISTTAGAGIKYTLKPIERSLRYWGIPKVYKYGLTLRAQNWSDMPLKKKLKYEKCLQQKTHDFYNSMRNKKTYIPLKTKIMFNIFKRFILSYPDGNGDKEYWRNKGWLEGKKPW